MSRFIDVKITGISELLHHRFVFSDEKETAAKKKTGKPDYSQAWKTSLYWNAETGVYQPAEHLEPCMVQAAVNFQIVGKGKKTYKSLFRSTVFIRPALISHHMKGTPDKLLENGCFKINKSRVNVQKAAVERLRPEFAIGWQLSFEIEVLDPQVPDDVVQQVLEHGGRFVGIGDYRPKFGRFSIASFKPREK